MTNTKRVYFPVESLVGLGHFNRTGKIVRGMVQAGFDVSVASSTFLDPDRFFSGAKHLSIPDYVFEGRNSTGLVLQNDGSIKRAPNFNPIQWRANRSIAHVRHVSKLKPDIVITEFWPFDRSVLDQEMHAMLEATNRVSSGALKIVSARDVLDVPIKDPLSYEVISAAALPYETIEENVPLDERERRAVYIINKNFKAVLVHGDPKFISFGETFSCVGEIKADIVYTGYVIDELPKRLHARGSNQRQILVSCGSGVDGDEMVYAFLTAWQKLLKRAPQDKKAQLVTDVPVHIITGPRFNNIHYRNVTEWVRDINDNSYPHITIEKYRSDYTAALASCTFSISLAGYNTTLETLAIQTPGIFVPKYVQIDGRLKIAAEQLYRLEKLKKNDIAAFAHPQDVQNSGRFADIIANEFVKQTTEDRPRPRLNFSGAANTLTAIRELSSGRFKPSLNARKAVSRTLPRA